MIDKVLDLKSAPLWFLLGLTGLAGALLAFPQLQAGLPSVAIKAIPLAFVTLAILSACFIASRVSHWVAGRHARRILRDRERMVNVYRPMALLFTRKHLMGSRGIGARYLRQRVQNALDELKDGRKLSGRIKRALRALSDQQITEAAEIEFGGAFPLNEIHEIARSHAAFLDASLIHLIRRADRSTYDFGGTTDLLTDEQRELAEHIVTEHDRLSIRCEKSV